MKKKKMIGISEALLASLPVTTARTPLSFILPLSPSIGSVCFSVLYKWNNTLYTVCIWKRSFHLMFVRFIHVALCTNSLFLFIQVGLHCNSHRFSPIDGHFSGSQSGDSRSNMNTVTKILVHFNSCTLYPFVCTQVLLAVSNLEGRGNVPGKNQSCLRFAM